MSENLTLYASNRLRTSRKNFFAPTARAFLRAASKSFARQSLQPCSKTPSTRGLAYLLLADIGHKRNDLIALLDEPCKDARGVCERKCRIAAKVGRSVLIIPRDRGACSTHRVHQSTRAAHGPSTRTFSSPKAGEAGSTDEGRKRSGEEGWRMTRSREPGFGCG